MVLLHYSCFKLFLKVYEPEILGGNEGFDQTVDPLRQLMILSSLICLR